jgi:hypothetical protein
MIGDMKELKWEQSVIVCIAIGMIVLNILPSILFKIRLTPDREYIPVHNSLSDYPYYTSIIAQGIDGQTAVVDRFTNEPHTGAYIHVLYLAIGWVGKLTGFSDAHGLYHGARILFGILWMCAIYVFIRRFVHTPIGRIAAFFFAVCGAGFPIFQFGNGTWFMYWPLDWWTEFNPMLRAVFLPHYLLGHSLFIFGLLSFMTYIKKGTYREFILGSFFAVTASIIHPPSYLMLGMLVFFYGIFSRRFKRTLLAVVGVCTGIFPLLYYRSLYTTFPWTLASSYERGSFDIPIMSYILGLGPVLFFGIAGFVLTFRKKETWIFFLWVLVPSILVQLLWYVWVTPLSRYVSISNIRFLQVAIWIPLAIGTGYSIEYIIKRFPFFVGMIVCICLAILTFSGYPKSIQTESGRVFGGYEFQFPKRGYIDALKFTRLITNVNDVVLALPLAGQIIPSYANRTVYVGNMEFYTQSLSHKMDNAWAFYVGIPLCEAHMFVTKNRIMTVFYGYDEQKAGDAVLKYPFLKLAGTFGETKVFAVDANYSGCD